MYAALGRLYETPPVQFSYPDKLKKINKKSVDFSFCFVYINTINRTEHELVKREHELDAKSERLSLTTGYAIILTERK